MQYILTYTKQLIDTSNNLCSTLIVEGACARFESAKCIFSVISYILLYSQFLFYYVQMYKLLTGFHLSVESNSFCFGFAFLRSGLAYMHFHPLDNNYIHLLRVLIGSLFRSCLL